MTTVTIGYWRFRGLAQPIRLLLAYTETPFQEVVYDFAEKQRWFDEDKKNIGMRGVGDTEASNEDLRDIMKLF